MGAGIGWATLLSNPLDSDASVLTTPLSASPFLPTMGRKDDDGETPDGHFCDQVARVNVPQDKSESRNSRISHYWWQVSFLSVRCRPILDCGCCRRRMCIHFIFMTGDCAFKCCCLIVFAGEYWIGAFSVLNCYPIREVIIANGQVNSTVSTNFYDTVEGILNPDDFLPPAECQNATWVKPDMIKVPRL